MSTRDALAIGLVAVLLTGCAVGREQERTVPAPGAATPTQAPSEGTTPSPTPSVRTPSVRTVAVDYAGGRVTGTSGREEVTTGERVVLRITSDVAEEVHVHGYDLEEVVPAGGSVEIALTATIPGVFEVELHDSGRVLLQLRVA